MGQLPVDMQACTDIYIYISWGNIKGNWNKLMSFAELLNVTVVRLAKFSWVCLNILRCVHPFKKSHASYHINMYLHAFPPFICLLCIFVRIVLRNILKFLGLITLENSLLEGLVFLFVYLWDRVFTWYVLFVQSGAAACIIHCTECSALGCTRQHWTQPCKVQLV